MELLIGPNMTNVTDGITLNVFMTVTIHVNSVINHFNNRKF